MDIPSAPESAVASGLIATEQNHPTNERKWGLLLFKSLMIGAVLGPAFYLWSMLPSQQPSESVSAARAPAPINEQTYDAVPLFIPKKAVYELMGAPGEVIYGPEWPTWLPHQWGGNDVVWERWTDPVAPDRWIAVALANDIEMHVVAKKKGGF
jgi:hypothetical protein